MVNKSSLDGVFAALSDPTRRRMVERLARGPMTVGEMSRGFAISQPGVSKHVKVLENSGLIKREIVGRVHRCTLEPGAMHAAVSWLEDQRRFWNATLDRLESLLAAHASNGRRPASNKTKKKKQKGS
jgi:DNA-binding transcriptional ArsR family regulator